MSESVQFIMIVHELFKTCSNFEPLQDMQIIKSKKDQTSLKIKLICAID